jgi:hypothetical protein
MRASAELDSREQPRRDCPMGALANDALTTNALAHTGTRGRNGPTISTNPVADAGRKLDGPNNYSASIRGAKTPSNRADVAA